MSNGLLHAAEQGWQRAKASSVARLLPKSTITGTLLTGRFLCRLVDALANFVCEEKLGA